MSGAADTIFVGGSTFTAGDRSSQRQGLAVRSGRIVAVDTDEALRELAGPDTDVVDLGGGLLVPGFQDAHVHPVMAGVDMLRCDVHRLRVRRRVR